MARSTTSVRLDNELREHLGAAAAAEGTTVTELIERSAMAMLLTPASYSSSARRAAVPCQPGGPDVWEIVAALHHVTGNEAKRIATLAEQLGLHERQVVIALNYAAAHRAEIDERIGANDRALAEAERVAAERERLLA